MELLCERLTNIGRYVWRKENNIYQFKQASVGFIGSVKSLYFV